MVTTMVRGYATASTLPFIKVSRMMRTHLRHISDQAIGVQVGNAYLMLGYANGQPEARNTLESKERKQNNHKPAGGGQMHGTLKGMRCRRSEDLPIY